MRFDKPLNLLTALMLYLIVVMPFEGTIITHASDLSNNEISNNAEARCQPQLMLFEEGQRFEFEVSKPNLIGTLTYNIQKVTNERILVQGVLTYHMITPEEEDLTTLKDDPVIIKKSFWIDTDTCLASSQDYLALLWNAYIKDYVLNTGVETTQENGKKSYIDRSVAINDRRKLGMIALINPPDIEEKNLEYESGAMSTFSLLENRTLMRLNHILEKMNLPIRLVR